MIPDRAAPCHAAPKRAALRQSALRCAKARCAAPKRAALRQSALRCAEPCHAASGSCRACGVPASGQVGPPASERAVPGRADSAGPPCAGAVLGQGRAGRIVLGHLGWCLAGTWWVHCAGAASCRPRWPRRAALCHAASAMPRRPRRVGHAASATPRRPRRVGPCRATPGRAGPRRGALGCGGGFAGEWGDALCSGRLGCGGACCVGEGGVSRLLLGVRWGVGWLGGVCLGGAGGLPCRPGRGRRVRPGR